MPYELKRAIEAVIYAPTKNSINEDFWQRLEHLRQVYETVKEKL